MRNATAAVGFGLLVLPRPLVVFIVAVLGVMFAGLLLVAGPLIALAVAVACAVFLAGLRSTSIALGAVLLTIPIQGVGAVAVGPADLTWTKIVVGAAVLAWGCRVLVAAAPLRIEPIGVAFTAYVAVLLASVVNAQSVPEWAGEVYRWGIALVVYLMALSGARERAFSQVVLTASAIAVLGSCAGGLSQVLTGAGPASFTTNGLTRAYSAFGEPNPFAGYLEMTLPLLAAVTLSGARSGWFRADWWRRPGIAWPWLFGSVVGAITLVLTQSRGGMLGFGAGMAAVLFLTGGWARRGLVAGGLTVGGLAVILSMVGPLGGRLSLDAIGFRGGAQVTPANFAVQERLAHWRAGLAMAEAYPALGVGAGNYSERFRSFTEVWRFRISRGHAHNTYIHAAAQSGVVGLTAYLAIFAAVLYRLGVLVSVATRAHCRSLLVGAIGVTVAVMVHGMFDYLHVHSLGLQLSIVWALAEVVGVRSLTPMEPDSRIRGG